MRIGFALIIAEHMSTPIMQHTNTHTHTETHNTHADNDVEVDSDGHKHTDTRNQYITLNCLSMLLGRPTQ